MRFLFFLALICWSGYGQAEFPSAFDAVSVKIALPPSPGTMPRIECRGGPGTKDPELWICRYTSLKMLVQLAYDVRAYQIASLNVRGGPFDIVARVKPGTTRDQFRIMVQGFLADRFHLAFHWETKEMPVYDLVVGKGGLKTKESENQTEELTAAVDMKLSKPRLAEDGYPALPPQFSGVTIMEAPNGATRARLHSPHETMEELAAMLTGRLGRPVINKTELKGVYDVSLFWELDPHPGVGGEVPASSASGASPIAEPVRGPSLETALQEQLGLKLVNKRDNVKTLVVDHADSSPSEN